jgi:aerobic-type carbon monoxide dehydrogenase small subunit (CoxS/CutS family)
MKKIVAFAINDEQVEIEIEPYKTLLEVLREDLSLTGTKEGCGLGACGACTVLIEGLPVLSCLTPALEVKNKHISTIEGLMRGDNLDPIQLSFVEHGAIQCGFCTPGVIMSSKALLGQNPRPSRKEIKDAISGNLCRCTGYKKIIEAVESVANGSKCVSHKNDN